MGKVQVDPVTIIAAVTALLELANKLYDEYQKSQHQADPTDADWLALQARRKAALALLLSNAIT